MRMATGLAAAAICCSAACADVIYDSGSPFGGPFGLIGFDVCATQSVGVRFEPAADYELDTVGLWFMNNSFDGSTHAEVIVEVRDDAGTGIPGPTVLETMSFTVSAVGWNPVLETVVSVDRPLLAAGERYWIVCRSAVACGDDGVWNWSAEQGGFTSNTSGTPDNWQAGGEGAVPAVVVNGTPAASCPGDYNGDGVRDTSDFFEFFGDFFAAPPDADYNGDGSTDTSDFFEFFADFFGPACE